MSAKRSSSKSRSPGNRSGRQAARGRAAARRKPASRPAPDDLTHWADGAGPVAASAPVATLRVLRCPDASVAGRVFAVGAEDVTLGREVSSTIALADPDVSRHHARIVRTGNSHVLVDMESTNGTQVNGNPVTEVTLRPGDRLLLGSTTLVYEA